MYIRTVMVHQQRALNQMMTMTMVTVLSKHEYINTTAIRKSSPRVLLIRFQFGILKSKTLRMTDTDSIRMR